MEQDQTTIADLESISLPIYALRTALFCSLKTKPKKGERDRPYLRGVYVHQIGDEYRIVATDGGRLLVFSHPVASEQPVPEWAKQGVTISAEGLNDRLALLEKLNFGAAQIAYSADAPHIQISDPSASCLFKVQPARGTFPDYQSILDKLSAFDAYEAEEMSSAAFDAGYLKDAGGIAGMLGSKIVRVHRVQDGEPTLVTFPECPFAVMIQLPVNGVGVQLGAGAARVLLGAVNGTIGALRAHQTRWRIAAAKPETPKAKRAAAEKKVVEYEERIAAITAAAQVQTALPAPSEDQVEQPDAPADFSIAAAVSPEPDLAVYRRGLKSQAQKRARLQFTGDLNAALSAEHDGLTVSQLADGVPVDDWFDAGLSPEDAAARCLDWRRIGDVLPPDEVRPGEADKPVGLLQSGHRHEETIANVETGEQFTVTVHGGEPPANGEIVEPPAPVEPAKPARAKRNGKAPKTDEAFDRFKRLVSGIIERRKGVSLDDLVDVPLRDWFESGLTAKKAAGRAIRAQQQS